MLENSLQKIDKYYLGLSVILVLMAVLLVFSFKGVFSAFLTAISIDPLAIENQRRINETQLNEAYSWAFNRTPVRLEAIRQ